MKIISLLLCSCRWPWPWNIWHPASIWGSSAKLASETTSTTMTMGIVAVASLAERKSPTPVTTITSTLRRTSSVASAGRRSTFVFG